MELVTYSLEHGIMHTRLESAYRVYAHFAASRCGKKTLNNSRDLNEGMHRTRAGGRGTAM